MLPRGSELWIDGGHNPSAARLVADYARRNWKDGCRWSCCSPALRARMRPACCSRSSGIADQVLTLPIEDHECRTPDELAALARKHGLLRHARSRSIADALIGAQEAERECWCSARSISPAKRFRSTARCRTDSRPGVAFADHARRADRTVDQPATHHQPEQDDAGQRGDRRQPVEVDVAERLDQRARGRAGQDTPDDARRGRDQRILRRR